MILLELQLRHETPVFLRIATLLLIMLPIVMYALNSSWFVTNRVLAGLPLQRFKWASETYLSSGFNRVSSVLLGSLASAIFIYAHFYNQKFNISGHEFLNFVLLFLLIFTLIGLKLMLMKFFFSMHKSHEAGTLIIDFQYAYNVQIGLLLTCVIAVDLYFFRLSNYLYISASILIGLLILLRLMGTIMLLLNKFSHPIISLFIYLCAFEIVPMLVIAKVIFVKS